VDFPSKAELKLLIDGVSDQWRAFLLVAIFAGLRASELRGLPWSSVDLAAGIIHVRQRADFLGTIGSVKSAAGARDVPLTPAAINALKAWKLRCPAGELVFPNRSGRVQALTNIRSRFWIPLQEKLGMTNEHGEAKYNFHLLRHCAASLFIEHLGWSPKRLQAAMGHSSITQTYDRYGHLFNDAEADANAMARMEAAVVAT
jgi:integrase